MAPFVRRIRDEMARRSYFLRVFGLLALSCLCFYVGKRWASRYEQVMVYSRTSHALSSSLEGHVSLVDHYREQEEEDNEVISNRSEALDNSAEPTTNGSPRSSNSSEPTTNGSPRPSNSTEPTTSGTPRPSIFSAGILQDDGAIVATNFPIEENVSTEDETLDTVGLNSTGSKIKSYTRKKFKFEVCPPSMKEYIPCLDNVAAVKRLPSTRRGESWERHCPSEKGARFCCLISAPAGYRFPIRWPKSRNEVWYNNVPHTRLVEDKGGQNWIAIKKDKFVFPGGGTQFAHGAGPYLDQMEKMVPDIAFGVHTRVALDIGCGVASWGAYLMSRNVLPLSIAPKDVHENQIQFALERGVPAMVAALATRRLLYPSQAFELIHCSRCRIEWTGYGGILLLEVDRILRGGGFFAWAAQPVYKHEGNLPEEWHAMSNLAESICWKLVGKQGYLAIWQKPFDNSCYKSRLPGSKPPICGSENNPDDVWYTPMAACITPFPSEEMHKNVSTWPERLHVPPQRLLQLKNDANMAKEEAFIAEERYWNEVVTGYLRGLGLKREEVRNVMDMNAGYGGFAAAVVSSGADWWVMNIVPVNSVNTLPVIYDRGLIGAAHDWCESFDTYPRTYDLLHAAGLFTMEESRCDITHIIVEMDRMLRPGGWVLVRDSFNTIKKVESLAKAARWETRILETESGPYGKDKLLSCKKLLWHA